MRRRCQHDSSADLQCFDSLEIGRVFSVSAHDRQRQHDDGVFDENGQVSIYRVGILRQCRISAIVEAPPFVR